MVKISKKGQEFSTSCVLHGMKHAKVWSLQQHWCFRIFLRTKRVCLQLSQKLFFQPNLSQSRDLASLNYNSGDIDS